VPWLSKDDLGRKIDMTQPIHVIAKMARVLRGGLAAALMVLAAAGGAVAAENPFSPVKLVNGQIITLHELDQRMVLLRLLGAQGDLRDAAMKGLIDDRLRMARAKTLGLSLSPDAIMAGMEEFASRGTLSAEEFIQAIGERGVAIETFRDFVSAGLIWRDVVRSLYNSKITITPAAVDRALTNLTPAAAQTVRYAEIVLEAAPANLNAALALTRNLQIDFIKGRSFEDAARAVSIGQTARAGGAREPQLLSQLAPELAVVVRSLQPGGVSKPVLLDDKIYLFQMIEQSSQPVPQQGAQVTDYIEFTLPPANSAETLVQLRRAVDSCDDLYARADAARGINLRRFSAPISGIPADAAGVLAQLDAGEMAGGLQRGGGPAAVMLCARGLNPTQQASRDEVENILRNQRLAALADIHLTELRAMALITDP
jgi:peptidyl-prolyl cis-trans isomerase SurA